MTLAAYISSLIATLVLCVVSAGSVPLLVALCFCAWLGGWTARELTRRPKR